MAGFSFGTPTTSAPSFSLGSNPATGGTPGFNFGAPPPSATAATTLQFNAPASVSGAVTFGTPASTGGSGFTFGSSGGLSMGSPAPTQATTMSFKPGTLGGGLNFGSPSTPQQSTLGFVNPTASTAPTGLTFGSTTATNQQTLSFGSTPATSQALSFGSNLATAQPLAFGSNPATSQPLSFGSNPATSQPLSFGSNPATSQPLSFGSNPPATSQPLSFGSNPPATSQPLSFGSNPPATSQPLSFGSNPATSQTLNFGSTPATTQPTLNFGSTPNASQPLSFGSTLGTTQTTLGFGSTPASTQAGLTFGTTPASTQGGLSFGSAPTSTQPGLAFGSAPVSTQGGLTFGSTPASTQAGLSFGTTPATSQPTLNFGLSTPATTASAGFSLGAPASTASGLSFGLGSQAATAKPAVSFGITASTTTAPTLLNFSTPKTTVSTGFSLSVSAGTGTFSLPSTMAPPTTAPAVFKGLGGVDPSTTQGSGQKDAKSVKENVVNAEIMQTLDTFKNFVKQQKNLSCEVSRAPVKPMHKVTEDTDALQKLLISVSSALQKNRVIANKLKNDTTKCLSLCEMAQRTHDTPLGLQNDNVAPLEFFIQLVSKFERDIQVLRQEIDNTEKHVNSLSYPAILTPQELSEALRRLHDSFVALAGRLQTAHAGVIAQKERHLSLRRHFLKDHTNIFENSSSTALTAKKTRCHTLPMPGPTPFSSIGGLQNINFMAGQDKPVTFSTGPTNLSGWGSSTMSSLNSTPASSFLQSSGTISLSSPQGDNQNFQLGKPPPGNKRGKR